MTDFKDIIAEKIYDESLGLSQQDIKGMIEIPADEKMGDYAFPCFRLAKVLRKAPQLIAADIAAKAGGSNIKVDEDGITEEYEENDDIYVGY